MEPLWWLMQYAQDHPVRVGGLMVAVIAVYYWMKRPPRLVRDANAEIERLRKERAGYYDKLRPPR